MLVKTRRQGTMTGKKSRTKSDGGQRWADVGRGLTDAVQPVDGDGFEGAAHHGVLLQHLVEVVDGEREEAAVGVGAHAGRAPPLGQQADLCRGGGRGEQTRQSKDHTMRDEC